jgi:hypothetical protein
VGPSWQLVFHKLYRQQTGFTVLTKFSNTVFEKLNLVLIKLHCPHHKPHLFNFKRPARYHKSPIQNRFTAENVDDESPPRDGADSKGLRSLPYIIKMSARGGIFDSMGKLIPFFTRGEYLGTIIFW